GEPVGAVIGRQGVAAAPTSWSDQLHAALIGLGYAPREADEAVALVTPQAEAAVAAGAQPPVPQLLRAALQSLNRTR
ncbi:MULTISPECIES: RuvA C-terminal domain-containing protein, partial [unclassified Streptomyces]|uniref:RuvA C-terminal domain-containing protein n=1 Tax=Streptomyces sp. SID4917 TaxID=2690269 RepID=UPI00081E73BC